MAFSLPSHTHGTAEIVVSFILTLCSCVAAKGRALSSSRIGVDTVETILRQFTMKNPIKWISLSKLFKDDIKREAMVTLANSFELPALAKRLGFRVIGAVFSRTVKFTGKSSQLAHFFSYLLLMAKNHGHVQVVSYLKSSQLALQRKVAGSSVESLREIEPDRPLPRLASCGLPRIIPSRDRRAILQGSPSVIRWWLTLFSVYRIIKLPGVYKLNTITDPFSGDHNFLENVSDSLAVFAAKLKKGNPSIKIREQVSLIPLETASPSSKTSWLGALLDPSILKLHGLERSYISFLEQLGFKHLLQQFKNCIEFAESRGGYMKIAIPMQKSYEGEFVDDNPTKPMKPFYAGQLSTKLEAAGKIRVFAMVDLWTQSAMQPIHKYLFDFLKTIPNDATFDQEEAVKRCFQKANAAKKSYGFDLSAATDRLPIDLQVGVLSSLIGRGPARLWRELLVNRDYVLPHVDDEPGREHHKVLRYEVGQPMGALSSWAMLALTHHLLVQYAYSKVNHSKWEWFEGYELLGDDIVIFDKDVADSYLAVMQRLGVGINLAKSVIAEEKPVFEFAKVTGVFGRNCSALSWKMFISQNTIMGRVNIAFSLLRKGIVTDHVMRWFHTLCRKSKWTKGSPNWPLFAFLTMLSNTGAIPYELVIQSLYDQVKPERAFFKSLLLKARVEYIQGLIMQTINKKEFTPSKRSVDIWKQDAPWAKIAIFQPVFDFAKNFDGEAMVVRLAKAAVKASLPQEHPLKNWVLTFNQVFRLNGDWDETDCRENNMFLVYFHMFFGPVTRLQEPFSNMHRSKVDSPIEELMKLREDMDRLYEINDIVERMWEKAEKGSPRPDTKLASPLKVLVFLRRVRKEQERVLQEFKRDFMTR